MKHKKDYPESHAFGKQKKAKMMEGVYGGPDFFARPDPQMFQAVYGGPDFFAQQNTQSPVPAPAIDGETRRKWCASCGRDIDASSKFCPVCGAPQTEKVCSACGAPIVPKAPFCVECGTPVPKDDDA